MLLMPPVFQPPMPIGVPPLVNGPIVGFHAQTLNPALRSPLLTQPRRAFQATPAVLPKSDSIGTGLSLVDPITQSEKGIRTKISEYVVPLNGVQKAKLSLKNLIIETPRSVWKGLTGDPAFEFSDKMRVAQIPYYLGGAALVGSYLAPGGPMAAKNALRPALACLGYFAGFPIANTLVNTLYRLRYGVDLDLRYHNNKGQMAGVFDSVMFDRDDLLPSTDLQRMRRHMHIPENIAGPDWEVRRQLDGIAPSAKVSKMVLGNVLAAVGAGYLAHLSGTVFHSPKALLGEVHESLRLSAPLGDRLRAVASVMRRYAEPPAGALKAPKWPGGLAAFSVVGSLLYTLFAMEKSHTRKHYEAPGYDANQGFSLNLASVTPTGYTPAGSLAGSLNGSLQGSLPAGYPVMFAQGGRYF